MVFVEYVCWSLQIDSICLDVATGSVPMDDTWWRCLRQWENSYFYAWLKFFLLFTAMFCSCEQKINCNSVSPIKTAYWIGHKELFPTISIDSYSQRDFRSLASSFLCQCENKDKIFIFLLVFIFPFLLLSCYLYRQVEFRAFPNLLIFHFALITQNICNILVLSHNNFQSFFYFSSFAYYIQFLRLLFALSLYPPEIQFNFYFISIAWHYLIKLKTWADFEYVHYGSIIS